MMLEGVGRWKSDNEARRRKSDNEAGKEDFY